MELSAAQSKRHLSRVISIGCIACLNMEIENPDACAHHVRHGQGIAQRADDIYAIPLCHPHHQGGGMGVALHAGIKSWEAKHGSEVDLLLQVWDILGIEYQLSDKESELPIVLRYEREGV